MQTGRVARGVVGRTLGLAVAAVVAVLALSAGVASAHDPIIITDRQTSPDTGPVLPDGTISFALYGVVHAPDDTRGFAVRFAAGDRLSLSLLIPALDPEQSLGPDELPTLQVARPDGSTFDVRPTESVVFDEAFSKTRYVRLAEVDEAAQAGEYRVTIVGHAPSRFTVSVGSQERFGTPVEQVDDRSAGVGGVQSWYATPPASAPAAPTTVPATTVVDAPVSAVDATATAPSDAPDTTPAADTVPPTAVDDSSADAATSSVPGGAPSTTDGGGSGAAGSAVFFGAMAIIVAVGVVLYVRRTRR